MSYDEMPAGPEMDFLVATKFLGQEPPEVRDEPDDWVPSTEGWYKTEEYVWKCEMPDLGEDGEWLKGWTEAVWPSSYSVKMFLLTELLRELVSDEYEVGIRVCFDGGVECDIWRNAVYLVGSYVESLDEIPLAVCRAVLKLKIYSDSLREPS